LVTKIQQPDKSVIQRSWAQNRPAGCSVGNPCNPYIQTEWRSTAQNGVADQAAAISYLYDQNGNVTAATEYDWAACSSGNCSVVVGNPIRTTMKSYQFYTNPATSGTTISDNGNAYWDWPGKGVLTPLNLLAGLTVSDASGSAKAASSYSYGDSHGHYNLSQELHWDSAISGLPISGSNSAVTTYGYDQYGNRTSITNPRGYVTMTTYDGNYLCPTQRVVSSGYANQRTFTFQQCDFNTGLPTGVNDVDHSISKTFSYDRFGRLAYAGESGGGISRTSQTTYYDSNSTRYSITKTDLKSPNDGLVARSTYYDQFGRVRQVTDGAGNTVQTLYVMPQSLNPQNYQVGPPPCLASDGSQAYSFQLTSNAYVTGTETSAGWTRTGFDQNGRVIEVAHFTEQAMPCPWLTNTTSTGVARTSYSSSSTTVTDESGVTRTSYVDGLGRLTHVTENAVRSSTTPPNAPVNALATTFYGYDVLDDLTSVTPPSDCGTPASACTGRTFNYSSLKRLTSATNPENGQIAYAYDASGNLHTRTSGGITTTYSYDELDELTGKTYPDSSQSASYSYNKGWRTSASFGGATYAYNSFDGLGRITYATQTTNGQAYTFSFCPNGLSGYSCIGASGYNLIDEVTSMTLPSGTAVTSTYDAMGRPSGVSAQAASLAPVYGNNASYTPGGALQQLSLGNGLTEQTCYNDRQQPFVIRQRFTGATSCSNAADTNDMGYLGFTFPGGNNGNVSSQTIQYGATPHGANPVYPQISFTQNYAYDQANRLASVTETSSANWSQYFGYDAVGNRWLYSGAYFDPSTPVTGNIDPFDANNHLNSVGYTDGRGNQTSDGGYGFQYDEENRLTSSSMSGSTLATYAYDADGHRVMKVAGAETTVYVYNPQGELAAEYTTGATTTPCATTCYLMTDHLGSTRMQTDGSGNQIQLFDYAPFGEMLGSAGGRDGRWAGYQQSGIHFTGKEQEGNEGAYMHYFGARYYSGGLGRFMSPDKPLIGQDAIDPQSWNLYSYVRNNPLKFVDRDGHDYHVCVDNGNGGQNCFDATAAEYQRLYDQQNGQQGIDLPFYSQAGGVITCGGEVCGSATYFERGGSMGRDTFGEGLGIVLGKATAPVFGRVFGWFGRLIGRGVGNAVGSATSRMVLTGFSDAEKAMLDRALAAMEAAGENTGRIKELIKFQAPPEYFGFADPPTNTIALADSAFSSDAALADTLRHELVHFDQHAAGLLNDMSAEKAAELERQAHGQLPPPKQQ
jgi:RHS repeat-associated protein